MKAGSLWFVYSTLLLDIKLIVIIVQSIVRGYATESFLKSVLKRSTSRNSESADQHQTETDQSRFNMFSRAYQWAQGLISCSVAYIKWALVVTAKIKFIWVWSHISCSTTT